MTTRSAEAIRARPEHRCSRTFCDWQRYRSAFNEAIELPAMSEHLPGVTMTVHLAVSRVASGKRRAVISGQDLEFHRSLHIAFDAGNRGVAMQRSGAHPHR